jgi:Flp pilus assembly protein TadG
MRKRIRSQRGSHLAEFVASMAVGLPLLVLLVFVGLECMQFYTIKSAMEVGARTAARGLVIQYNKTGSKSTVVSGVTMTHFIVGSNQFAVAWDANSPPEYVTVTCAYPKNGANGLPSFPAGPLRYLSTNTIFSLNNIQVQGTFTLPVQ